MAGPDIRPRMQAYVATVCRDLNAETLRIGSVSDHLLCLGLRAKAFLESRSQRSFWGNSFPWGVAPGLHEPAPLALSFSCRVLRRLEYTFQRLPIYFVMACTHKRQRILNKLIKRLDLPEEL